MIRTRVTDLDKSLLYHSEKMTGHRGNSTNSPKPTIYVARTLQNAAAPVSDPPEVVQAVHFWKWYNAGGSDTHTAVFLRVQAKCTSSTT